jgi:predicted  nucleic acid-binding Zn-ribbon protein
MTQTNGHSDRLDRVEAILDRLAGQFEQADERMTRMEEQAAEESQHLRESLATLTDISIDFMRVTSEAVEELRAANQRQERINDFLLRERGLN